MAASTRSALSARETWLLGFVGLLIFFGIWSALTMSGFVPQRFLPTPLQVIVRFFDLLATPFAGATLPEHLWSSFLRFSYGFLLGAVIGIPLGLLMGWFRWLDDIVTPVFEGFRLLRRSLGCRLPRSGLERDRRPDSDHLCRRVPALPDQCLSRRALRQSQPHRSGADARHEKSADDPRNIMCPLPCPRSSRACASRRGLVSRLSEQS